MMRTIRCNVLHKTKRTQRVALMKKSRFMLSLFAFWTLQGVPMAQAFDFYGMFRGINDERYGCCLIKANAKDNLWEYTEGTSFSNCYKWAQSLGNPFQYHQDRKYEFHKNQSCEAVKGPKAFVPSEYTYYHQGNS